MGNDQRGSRVGISSTSIPVGSGFQPGGAKRIARRFLPALAAGLLLAVEAQADPISCFAGWFVVPFVDGPGVCGEAFVDGSGLDGVSVSSTVNPTNREQNGTGVLVGVVGGAVGAVGSASGNGSFGNLSFHTDADMTLPAPGQGYYSGAGIRARSSVGFIDGLTVTTGRRVRITSAVNGSFTGLASNANVNFFLQKNAPPGNAATIIIYQEANAFIFSGFPSSRFVGDYFLEPGTYSFRWAMQVEATASVVGGGVYGSATADASHQGRLFFDPLEPGAPLIFLSGHNYVPEPASGAMLVVGAGALGFAARRRRAPRKLAGSGRAD
ncbi:PEP-CTERM sorting domain-containing protein [Myxococcota bacterium]|nr:PEP-CTERM sorting domain-containing protein [Myxococcota bacterium]